MPVFSVLDGPASWINAHALAPHLPTWAYALIALIDTHITTACVTLYLHRAQTHRSISFNGVVEHFMRFWLWVRTAMPTREWVAVHRCHHAHVDTPDDPHSPIFFGIWRVVFFGTALYHTAAHDPAVVEQYGKGTPDDLIERRIYTPLSLLGPVVTLLTNVWIFGSWGLAMWLVEMAWIPFFAAGVINGLGHWWGYRNFDTPDHSRNLPSRFWSLITCGEALHNNHHHIQNSPRFAMRAGELDPGYWYFSALKALRLARARHESQMIAAGIALLILLVSSTAFAQVNRGELRLRVNDAAGQVLPGAQGTLASEAPALSRSFVTDAAGQTILADLPFGVYRLTITSAQFITRTEVVDVHSAVPIVLQVTLNVGLSVTENVASPLVDTRQTGIVFSLGAATIAETVPAVPGRRLLDLVDAQPGWLMEANGVLHPRGSEYQTLFVVDGLPMDENRSPGFAPEIEEGDVQGINVLTANFPAEYGRKLGGVVEVTTAKDIRRGWRGTADVGAGSFGTATGAASASYGWERRAITISGSGARTNRYLDPPVTNNFTNEGSLGGVSAAYDDRPSDSDRLRVTWRHSGTKFQVPNEQVQEEAGQLQERTGSDDLLQGAWTRIIGTRIVLNARGVGTRLSATLSSNAASTPIIVSQDRSLTRGYGNLSLAADYGHHQIKFGGDVVFAPVREELAYVLSDRSFFDPETATTFQFDDRKRDREQSLFVQDTIAAGAFTISAGVRWDRYAFVVNDQAISPRLGVAWATPNGGVVLRAAYDRAFQSPAVENLLLASSPEVDAVGNVVRLPVEPSRGHYFEGGFTAAIRDRARIDASVYRRTFQQFADDDVFLNTGVTFPIAWDRAAINGLDAKFTLLPWQRLSGFASYALMKGTSHLPVVGGLFLGEEAIAGLNDEGEVPITQDQRHTVRGKLRFDLSPRLWAGASVRYGSGLPVELEGDVTRDELETLYGAAVLDHVDFENGRVKPNFALDLGAGLQLWHTDRRRTTLRVEVANVTNRLNVINFAGIFSGTALGAPRSATVRMQLSF